VPESEPISPERTATLRWLALAAIVWLVAIGLTRWRGEPAPQKGVPAWQHAVSELTEPQQAWHRKVRDAILEAERGRSTGAWPELPGFALKQSRLTINYVGEADGLRWLVLLLEPDPRMPPENASLDDEHHRLADGTPLHVTVWTQPLTTPAPAEVTAFPAAEGWVERVRR
jgi:hypothetical protein